MPQNRSKRGYHGMPRQTYIHDYSCTPHKYVLHGDSYNPSLNSDIQEQQYHEDHGGPGRMSKTRPNPLFPSFFPKQNTSKPTAASNVITAAAKRVAVLRQAVVLSAWHFDPPMSDVTLSLCPAWMFVAHHRR